MGGHHWWLRVTVLTAFCLYGTFSINPFEFDFKKLEKKPSDLKPIHFLHPIQNGNLIHVRDPIDFDTRIGDIRNKIFGIELDNRKANLDSTTTLDLKEDDEQVVEIDDDIWDSINSDVTDLGDLSTLLGLDLGEDPDMYDIVTDTHSISTLTSNKLNGFSGHFDVAGRSALPSVPMPKNSQASGDYWAKPKMAGCQPELRTVELDLPKSENIFFFPSCVRANQCGGCCSNELHQCQPIAVKDITVKVVKVSKISANYNVNRRRPRRANRRRGRNRRSSRAQVNYVNKTIEEHTECQCLCKLRESSCDPWIHSYNDKTCSCDCLNSSDETKCIDESHKFWNKTTCLCQCREVAPCSSGNAFDHQSCSCRPIRLTRPDPV